MTAYRLCLLKREPKVRLSGTEGAYVIDDLDSLRDAIATDVLQDVPTAAIESSLTTLRDIKERIKGLSDPPDHIAAK